MFVYLYSFLLWELCHRKFCSMNMNQVLFWFHSRLKICTQSHKSVSAFSHFLVCRSAKVPQLNCKPWSSDWKKNSPWPVYHCPLAAATTSLLMAWMATQNWWLDSWSSTAAGTGLENGRLRFLGHWRQKLANCGARRSWTMWKIWSGKIYIKKNGI